MLDDKNKMNKINLKLNLNHNFLNLLIITFIIIIFTNLIFSQEQEEEKIIIEDNVVTEVFNNGVNSISIDHGSYIKRGDIIEITLIPDSKLNINGREIPIIETIYNKLIIDKNGELIEGTSLQVSDTIHVPTKGRSIFLGSGNTIGIEDNIITIIVNDRLVIGPVVEPEIIRDLSIEEKNTIIEFRGIELGDESQNNKGQGFLDLKTGYLPIFIESGDYFEGTLKYKYIENGDEKGHQAFIDDSAIIDKLTIFNKDKVDINLYFKEKFKGQNVERGMFFDFFKKGITIVGDGSFSLRASEFSNYFTKFSRGNGRNYHLLIQAGKNGELGIIDIQKTNPKEVVTAFVKGEYIIDIGSESLRNGLNENRDPSIYIDSENKIFDIKNSDFRAYPISIVPQKIDDGSYILNDKDNNPQKLIVGEGNKLMIVDSNQKVLVQDFDRLRIEDLLRIDDRKIIYNPRAIGTENVGLENSGLEDEVIRLTINAEIRETRNVFNALAHVRIGDRSIRGSGSGTIIGKDINGNYIILTARHVVDPRKYRQGQKIRFSLFGGAKGIAEVIDTELKRTIIPKGPDLALLKITNIDLALLKITNIEGFNLLGDEDIPSIPIADEGYQVNNGDYALRIGYPGAGSNCRLSECKVFFSSDESIETDSGPIPGESGGGLVTLLHKGSIISSPEDVRLIGTTIRGDTDFTIYKPLHDIHDMLNENNIKMSYLQVK